MRNNFDYHQTNGLVKKGEISNYASSISNIHVRSKDSKHKSKSNQLKLTRQNMVRISRWPARISSHLSRRQVRCIGATMRSPVGRAPDNLGRRRREAWGGTVEDRGVVDNGRRLYTWLGWWVRLKMLLGFYFIFRLPKIEPNKQKNYPYKPRTKLRTYSFGYVLLVQFSIFRFDPRFRINYVHS